MSFLTASQGAINRHGLNLVYSVITQGEYNVETGTTTETSADYTLKIYPKHITANNYSYPDLIGKDACMFYIANATLPFTPKQNDEIAYKNAVYRVQSYQEHVANGKVALYRIIAVKG